MRGNSQKYRIKSLYDNNLAFDKINDITPSKDTNDNGANTGIDGVDLSGFDINAEPLEEGADFADKFGESIDKLIE